MSCAVLSSLGRWWILISQHLASGPGMRFWQMAALSRLGGDSLAAHGIANLPAGTPEQKPAAARSPDSLGNDDSSDCRPLKIAMPHTQGTG
mmetsp:Transcript_27061/g.59393  ORF Transcript_27061/g.59393 Transcript_27061/m.59393 type:complete len:91 (+) Transcript_27061:770-1042(+)